jgi:hypothetical protein
MTRQINDPRRGWYDEIMLDQYYDELIPAYESQQARMAANSSLFMICVRGIIRLLTILRAEVRRDGCQVSTELEVPNTSTAGMAGAMRQAVVADAQRSTP